MAKYVAIIYEHRMYRHEVPMEAPNRLRAVDMAEEVVMDWEKTEDLIGNGEYEETTWEAYDVVEDWRQ